MRLVHHTSWWSRFILHADEVNSTFKQFNLFYKQMTSVHLTNRWGRFTLQVYEVSLSYMQLTLTKKVSSFCKQFILQAIMFILQANEITSSYKQNIYFSSGHRCVHSLLSRTRLDDGEERLVAYLYLHMIIISLYTCVYVFIHFNLTH